MQANKKWAILVAVSSHYTVTQHSKEKSSRAHKEKHTVEFNASVRQKRKVAS